VVRNRRWPRQREFNGNALSVWQMLDRLVLLLGLSRGSTCTVFLRDLIYPAHANAANIATARIVAVHLFPIVFPNADWEPVGVKYDTTSNGFRYNYRVVFRRKARQVPEADSVVQLLHEVVVREER